MLVVDELQPSLSEVEYGQRRRVPKREEFLRKMDAVVPWADWVQLIEPYYYNKTRGRRPIPLETMLRMYLLQVWFHLSDEGVEDQINDSYAMRKFMGVDFATRQVPDATTLLHFRHLLEEHQLGEAMFTALNARLDADGLVMRGGSIVDATIIAAPSSTKNATGTRDPEMRQTRKGNQWYFGMKAHAGVDADSGLVHTVRGTAGNVSDVVEANSLLHGQETDAFGDAGYQGVDKRPDAKQTTRWHVAMRPGLRRALDKDKPLDDLIEQLERTKARIRAKVEHPFRVLKQQFGYVKVRYRGLKKNTAQIVTLFALSNLWMVRHKLLAMGQVRVQEA